MTIQPPIEALLQHRGSMLLLEEVLDFSDDTALCRAVPAVATWYARADGAMPAWIGIELMAQTIAVHAALLVRRLGKPPRPGVLLGTRAYRASTAAFTGGQPLYVTAHQSYRDEAGLGAYDCTLADEVGQVLATATVTVFEPDDFKTFIHGEAN